MGAAAPLFRRGGFQTRLRPCPIVIPALSRNPGERGRGFPRARERRRGALQAIFVPMTGGGGPYPVGAVREPSLALRSDSHPLPRLPAWRTVVLRTDATSGTGRCKPYDESPSSTLEEAGPAAIPVYPGLRAGWYPPRGLPCRRYLHGHRPPVVAHRPLLSGAIGRCLGVVPGCAAGAPPRRRRCAGHGPSLRALCRIVLPEKYGPLPRARASILDMVLRALVTDRARPARRPPIGGHHRPPRPQAVTPRDARPMR